MSNSVPISDMKASLRVIDNTVILTSDDPMLEDWEGSIVPGTIADLKIRKALSPVEDTVSVENIVESFVTSKASHLTYDSGLTFSTQLSSLDSLDMIPIMTYNSTVHNVHVGLSFKNITTVSIQGKNDSGRSSFVKNFFPASLTSFVDFKDIDFSDLSPSIREGYGNAIALSFIRNANLKYLVLDHTSHDAAGRRRWHPALYHEMLQQIVETTDMLQSLDKVLVIADGDGSINSNLTINIEDKSEHKHFFSIEGIIFPPLDIRKR